MTGGVPKFRLRNLGVNKAEKSDTSAETEVYKALPFGTG